MSDFSLDDILDEYEKKSVSGDADDVDEILGDILGEDTSGRKKKNKKPPAAPKQTAEEKWAAMARREYEKAQEEQLLNEQRQEQLDNKKRLEDARKRDEIAGKAKLAMDKARSASRSEEMKRLADEEFSRIAEEEKKRKEKQWEKEEQERREKEERRRYDEEFIADLVDDSKRRAQRMEKEQRVAAERRRIEEARRAARAERKRLEEERKLLEQKQAEEEQRRLEEERRRLEEEQRLEEERLKQEQEEAQRLEEERLKQEQQEREEAQRLEEERIMQEQEAQRPEEEQEAALPAGDPAGSEFVVTPPLSPPEDTARGSETHDPFPDTGTGYTPPDTTTMRPKFFRDDNNDILVTKSIIIEDMPLELPSRGSDAPPEPDSGRVSTAQLELERELRRKKIEVDAQNLLIKEMELEDPDDFLTSLNPYEFGKKTGFTGIIETIPAQNLAGDTMSIAGNELKELARKSAKPDTRSFDQIVDGSTRIMDKLDAPSAHESAIDPDKTFSLPDDIKEYVPGGRQQEQDTREVHRKTPEEEELLRSINKTLERRREADRNDMRPPATNTGPYDQIRLYSHPTRPAEDIPRTGEVPISDPSIARQKAKELAAKRKRRISNFVFEDIEDDYDYSDGSAENYTDDETGLLNDLAETHKSLLLRMVLLIAVTVILIGSQIIQSVMAAQRIGAFGNELGFLSNNGVVFMNLICGVAGLLLCKSVLLSGIGNLFRGKPDCDSLCAISGIITIGTGVVHLIDTNELQTGRAFLYVPAALLGLVFNSFGKLFMIKRMMNNYALISDPATAKYYAEMIEGQSEAAAFTKGVIHELPYLVTVRKTEILTDFLRRSYCEDKADMTARRLVPAALVAAVMVGLLSYFMPNSYEINGVNVLEHNLYWSVSAATAIMCLLSPFTLMFIVNNPMRRASNMLNRSGCALTGYTAAEEFAECNSVLLDAGAIFPKSTIECTNIKPCRLQHSINNVSLDQAIILAASLTIKTGSVLSPMFYEMIGGDESMLTNIDGCVYEDNMGIMGWYGNKRLIMGNREHMKHHSIRIPEMSAIEKYCRNGSEAVYLAVSGELVTIFFIRMTADPEIRESLRELSANGISIVVKATDSVITAGRMTDLFEIDPERIKIIGSALHGIYNQCTRYTTEGSCALSLDGRLSSLSKALISAKKLTKDIGASTLITVISVVLGALIMIFFAVTAKAEMISPLYIIIWNTAWLVITLIIQAFRRY